MLQIPQHLQKQNINKQMSWFHHFRIINSAVITCMQAEANLFSSMRSHITRSINHTPGLDPCSVVHQHKMDSAFSVFCCLFKVWWVFLFSYILRETKNINVGSKGKEYLRERLFKIYKN